MRWLSSVCCCEELDVQYHMSAVPYSENEMNKPVSGFMPVKDCIVQGYPFVEAIVEALPLCDEFLISDGYSTDGTWDVLQTLREKFPDKIYLFRHEWRGETTYGQVLATMTNLLRAHCTGEWCFSVQANEVLHEGTVDEIRRLLQLYPAVESFFLPYYTLHGANWVWMVDWRRRLFLNKPYFYAIKDAVEFGYNYRAMWRTPRKVYRHVRWHADEWHHYLIRPVYRYRGLFPQNYLEKLKRHLDLWRAPDMHANLIPERAYALRAYQETFAPDAATAPFWKKIRKYFDVVAWQEGGGLPAYLPRQYLGEIDERPHLIDPLCNQWSYDVAASLARVA